MSESNKILLIYTGGTIGMVMSVESKALKPFDFGSLKDTIPELEHIGCTIDFEVLNPIIDSSNMSPAVWSKLARMIRDRYNDYDGFVILHGSDTMSYTASALSFMFENLEKPIILTGSQLPIGITRTDAKENLITSIEIAARRDYKNRPMVPEVAVYFEYHLYRGNRTIKQSASQFEAFASPNFPALAEAGVELVFQSSIIRKPRKKEVHLNDSFDNAVVGIRLFPGLGVEQLDHLISVPNIKCVVLETYGSGNASTDKAFLAVLQKAVKKGIHLVNVTQCSSGRVQMGRYEASEELLKIGMINGKDITFEAAITKAMYLLGQGWNKRSFKSRFEQNLRGELTP
jgi:L-asparaginase